MMPGLCSVGCRLTSIASPLTRCRQTFLTPPVTCDRPRPAEGGTTLPGVMPGMPAAAAAFFGVMAARPPPSDGERSCAPPSSPPATLPPPPSASASNLAAMATRCGLERRRKSIIAPSASWTKFAPGCSCGPLTTARRSTCTFHGVTGSGKVSSVAKCSGTPISCVPRFTSGEMTERQQKLTRLPIMLERKRPAFRSSICLTPCASFSSALPPPAVESTIDATPKLISSHAERYRSIIRWSVIGPYPFPPPAVCPPAAAASWSAFCCLMRCSVSIAVRTLLRKTFCEWSNSWSPTFAGGRNRLGGTMTYS
mmetsp:Transcript_42149/g.135530  ORF Transcript_42149/g.135530 Transcript_42149/m.135530 type:complete len:310 (+) Transcript_42149:816-1745(+)